MPDRLTAASIANGIAAEHLSLQVEDPDALLEAIPHAGAAFVGGLTPEAAGDYVAGPSHVLPTGGAVRFGSPLGVHDFIARTSIIRYGAEALAKQAKRVERVRDLIMATTHDANPRDPDAMLLVDIDLSILGADRPMYLRFEGNVRKEYSWVPAILFRRTRAGILQSILDRPSVYATASFRHRLEEAARANLSSAINELTGSPRRASAPVESRKSPSF